MFAIYSKSLFPNDFVVNTLKLLWKRLFLLFRYRLAKLRQNKWCIIDGEIINFRLDYFNLLPYFLLEKIRVFMRHQVLNNKMKNLL